MVSESLIAGDAMDQSAQDIGSQMISMGGNASVFSSLSNQDVLNNYEVRFSMTYIVTYLIAGIGTILLAAVLPLTYVMRLNRRKS